MTRVFTLIVILCFLSIDLCQSAAGRCYQCNSRNSLCGATVNESLKLDSTPCNGQCYTRINRNDENTVYRGCSWEHGFMTAQRTNLLILDAGSVWIFCDTPYCNFESKALLNTVCFQPICEYLKFPEDCKLPNADVTCGRYCGNKLCQARNIRRRYRIRKPFSKPIQL